MATHSMPEGQSNGDDNFDESLVESYINPKDMDKWDLLLRRARQRKVVPFIGAGISMPFLPSWKHLLQLVIDNLHLYGEDITAEVGECEACGNFEDDLTVVTDMIKGRLRKYNRTLADEITIVFQAYLKKRHVNDDGIDCLTTRTKRVQPWNRKAHKDMPPRNARVQAAVVSGPFPLILTTNWDASLEAAYDYLEEFDVCWPLERPRSDHFHRMSSFLPVRYRRDHQQLFAEIRAHLQPPRLLKLHGDLTDRGKKEIVAGYGDYRALMARDTGFKQLLSNVFTSYSILFYGCSLSDPDILANMDGIHETLGPETGPHFWLTADHVTESRKTFLWEQYSVHVVRACKPLDFAALQQMMVLLCTLAWALPPAIQFKGITVDVYGPPAHATAKAQVRSSLTEGHIERRFKVSIETLTVAETLIKPNKGMALAVSVGCGEDNRAQFGYLAEHTSALLGCTKEMHAMRDAHVFNRDVDNHWRAAKVHLPNECHPLSADSDQPMADRTRVYFVCGQAMTDGRTTVRGVYHATQHFLAKAIPDEQRLMGSGKRVVLWLPLLSAGDGGLNQHYVLNTMLNAIGNYASSEGWAGVVHIKISLGSKPENLGQSIPIRYDVMTGRLPVGDILSRGSKGKMEFTCVAHDTRRGWIVQHVQIDIRGTFEHLRVAMGLDELPFGYHANERLIECDITDGKVVQLLDKARRSRSGSQYLAVGSRRPSHLNGGMSPLQHYSLAARMRHLSHTYNGTPVSASTTTLPQMGDPSAYDSPHNNAYDTRNSEQDMRHIHDEGSDRSSLSLSDSIPATDIEAENSSTLMRSGSPFVPLTSLGDTGAARADTKEYESHHSPVSEQHPLRYDTTHTPGKQITCDTTHTPGKQTTDYPIHTPGKPITGHRVPVHASTEGGMVLAIDSRDRIVPNSGTRVVQMNEQSSSVDTEISPTSAEVAVSPFLPKSDKGCYGTSEYVVSLFETVTVCGCN